MCGKISLPQWEHFTNFLGFRARWLLRLFCLPLAIWWRGTAIVQKYYHENGFLTNLLKYRRAELKLSSIEREQVCLYARRKEWCVLYVRERRTTKQISKPAPPQGGSSKMADFFVAPPWSSVKLHLRRSAKQIISFLSFSSRWKFESCSPAINYVRIRGFGTISKWRWEQIQSSSSAYPNFEPDHERSNDPQDCWS